MLKQLIRSKPGQHIAHVLYNRAVEQARQPAFYRRHGVPDTLDGRFDMMILHVGLILARLGGESPEVARLRKRLFDRMIRDVDHNFRELGLSDMSMGKTMKRVVQAVNGRLAAYTVGLAARDDGPLKEAIWRNLYREPVDEGRLDALARYIREAARLIEQLDVEDLLAGHVLFPLVPEGDGARSGRGAAVMSAA